MARRKAGSLPTYRLHKSSGQAIVSLPRGDGTYQDVCLGVHGTPESQEEYARVLDEWRASRADGRPGVAVASSSARTVAELVAAYLAHAEVYYRGADGEPTNEYDEYVYAARPLVHLYGELPAREFSPLKLKAVRGLMVEGYTHPRHGEQGRLARGVINQRVRRVVRMFKWAASEELADQSVYRALATVEGLGKGRTTARETKKVEPVAWADVEPTLAKVNPAVRAMILVQWYTGARPGEVVLLRPCDIDRAGPVWVFEPHAHKTQRLGHRRLVAIGPKCQEVLAPWLEGCGPDEYVFSPWKAREARYAAMRAARKSKVPPSQRNRRKARPKRKPGEKFTAHAYGRAIADAQVAHGLPRWHPHQLRHAHATEARRLHGLDAVQVVLGHSSRQMSERYAEPDLELALRVAAAIG